MPPPPSTKVDEKEDLLELKAQWHHSDPLNPNARPFLGWDNTTDPCIDHTWANVTCVNGHITQISLRDMGLVGTIPSLTNLKRLTHLDLGGNHLSGELPALDELSSLQYLDLSDNGLSDDPPRSLVEACRTSAISTCIGVPPESCSAFGRSSRLSLRSLYKCVHCPPNQWLIITLISLTCAFFVGAFACYAYLVHRYPFFQTWIATTSICVHHMQAFMLLSSHLSVRGSHAEWVFRVTSAASTDLTVLRPECLLPQHLPMSYMGFVLGTGLPLAGLCILASLKVACKRVNNQSSPLSPAPSPRFSPAPTPRSASPMPPLTPPHRTLTMLPQRTLAPVREPLIAAEEHSAWQEPHSSLSEPLVWEPLPPTSARERALQRVAQRVDQIEDKLTILFSLQLPVVCRLSVNALALGPNQGADPNAMTSFVLALAILLVELGFLVKYARHLRAFVSIRRRDGGLYTFLPPERLAIRLKYLTRRYAPHAAAWWQFVIWARSILLTLSTIEIAPVGYQFTLALSVIVVAQLLHVRTQPYVYRYQNRLESALALNSAIFVSVGLAWYNLEYHSSGHDRAAAGLNMLLLLLALCPFIFFLGWFLDRLIGACCCGAWRDWRARAGAIAGSNSPAEAIVWNASSLLGRSRAGSSPQMHDASAKQSTEPTGVSPAGNQAPLLSHAERRLQLDAQAAQAAPGRPPTDLKPLESPLPLLKTPLLNTSPPHGSPDEDTSDTARGGSAGAEGDGSPTQTTEAPLAESETDRPTVGPRQGEGAEASLVPGAGAPSDSCV